MPFWITVYLVVGLLCAIALQIFLSKQGGDAGHYWLVLLSGAIESFLLTIVLWPLQLGAILAGYLLQAWADRTNRIWKEKEAERKLREEKSRFLALPLDELLKKVEEEKRARQ